MSHHLRHFSPSFWAFSSLASAQNWSISSLAQVWSYITWSATTSHRPSECMPWVGVWIASWNSTFLVLAASVHPWTSFSARRTRLSICASTVLARESHSMTRLDLGITGTFQGYCLHAHTSQTIHSPLLIASTLSIWHCWPWCQLQSSYLLQTWALSIRVRGSVDFE